MSAAPTVLSAEEHVSLLAATERVTQTTLDHLNANPNKTFAVTFVANLQRGVDSITQTAITQGEQFDCKAGCSHCCHVRVEALEPEVFQIVHALQDLAPDSLEDIISRLQRHENKTKHHSIADYRSPCPFLQQNLCSIYPVRPAACRKVHSYDVEQCEDAGANIPQSLEVILKSEALMKGTANAYQQAKLAASGHDLGRAVLLALTDEAAESRWYKGESVFNKIV
ncbi:MAG: YkgJ family cysteine cluster protein [Methylophilaceae bacterium]